MRFHSAVFGLVMLTIVACAQQEQIPVDVNVYHWKTSWGFQDPYKQVVKDLKSNKVYVRFFDVVFNEEKQEARPSAELVRSGEQFQGNFKTVPVVYFQNKVFQQDSTDYHRLSELLSMKLKRMSTSFGLDFNELQLDCDWTPSTRENFFGFCQHVKALNDSLYLTATIRLHQVKYPDVTGIPPVDHGILMCYNMGSLSDTAETNSIFDWEKTRAYIGKLDEYPLTLSLALPTFAWGVVYNDKGTRALINNLTIDDLQTDFIKKEQGNVYAVFEDRFYLHTLLHAGDRIRFEQVTIEALSDVWQELHSKRQFEEVILYHLHGLNLVNNEATLLYEIFN